MSGYLGIHFLIINSANSNDTDGKLFKKLTEIAGKVNTYQEQVAEPVWKKLNVLENSIIILDKCGRLTYHVLTPWSLLHQPYVKAAILSTYMDNPCGRCITSKKDHKPPKKLLYAEQNNEEHGKKSHSHTGVNTMASFSPLVNGAVPIKITYQKQHTQKNSGKENSFNYINLQSGSTYHREHHNQNIFNKKYFLNYVGEKNKIKLKIIGTFQSVTELNRNYVRHIVIHKSYDKRKARKPNIVKIIIKKKMNDTTSVHEKTSTVQPNQIKINSTNENNKNIDGEEHCILNNCSHCFVSKMEILDTKIYEKINKTSQGSFLNRTDSYNNSDATSLLQAKSIKNSYDEHSLKLNITESTTRFHFSDLNNNYSEIHVGCEKTHITSHIDIRNVTSKADRQETTHNIINNIGKNVLQMPTQSNNILVDNVFSVTSNIKNKISNSEGSNDYSNNKEDLQRIIEHYRKLLPWVNYNLSTAF